MDPPPGNENDIHQNVAAKNTQNDEPVVTDLDVFEPLEKIATGKELSGGDASDQEKRNYQLQRHVTSRTEATTNVSSFEEDLEEKEVKRKWYRQLNPLKRDGKPPVPKEREISHEYGATFLSMLTFHWIAPLMGNGYQRPLEPTDIWRVNPERGTEIIKQRLNTNFKKRLENGGKRPLAMALYDTFRAEFLVGAFCQLLSSILQALTPFILRYLISFATEAWNANFRRQPAPSIGRGMGWVIAIVAMQVIQTVSTNHFMYRGMMVGGQARGVLIAVIFDKTMKLSGRARAGGVAPENAGVDAPPGDIKPGSEQEKKWYKTILRKKKVKGVKAKGSDASPLGWSNGRIINLMSTDTYRVDTASGLFHMIWSSPIMILLTLVLLIINITYSALAGFALLVVAMLLLGRSFKSLFRRRVAINKITDQRVALTQEILSAVRFVKYFAWELSFLDRLEKIRKLEIREIQFLLSIRNAILALGMVMPVFASMIAFITYSLSGYGLSPAPIFSSLALFNGLRATLNFLPMVLGQVIDAVSSLERIQEFLLAEEAHDDAVWDSNSPNAVEIKNADFTWEKNVREEEEDSANGKLGNSPNGQKKKEEKTPHKAVRDSSSTLGEQRSFKIQGIDINIGRNELVAVIGTVGCGKSSLLAALAGDMRRTSGQVIFGASRAFCPQYAWIQNATVRDNIVFGRPFDQKWYDQVVDACALRPDLEMLPNGDQTEIGEKGITVSGGQKQRLNIARAIYFNANIILMDDPLSAVDAHVGKHIMDKAICGLMRNKSRLLATHQLHVLNRCDRIILMGQGRISAVGTFEDLMANSKAFQQLIATTVVEEKQKETAKEAADGEKELENRKKYKKGAALMQNEERAVKSVHWSVYLAYLRAAGSYLVAPLVFFLMILCSGSTIVTSLWLSWWTSNKFGYSEGTYIGIYAALGVTQALSTFAFSVALSVFSTKAGQNMLKTAIYRVLRAPMSFFDTTPLGRITNRFSKDIDTLDNNLGDSWRMLLITISTIVSVFILVIAYFYYFAIALGPLFVLFCFAASYYRASAREIKRHESVLRSHVFSRFSEAVTGAATIRAYGLQDQFAKSAADAIDDMNSAYYLTFANQRWLSVRLDAIGILLIFVTGILIVTSHFNVDPSVSGLVLSYILAVVQAIQFTVRQLAEVENNMNATERIHYYCTQLEQEAPLQLAPVRPSWPERGEIVFDNVQMRYREGLPLVLRNMSMHVRPGEKIGVVGRTGAGKSSIMSTLYRLIELSGGKITIDGIDISTIGLHDLRSRLAIIPQDPTLLKGTVRSNLDPFDEHTDLELWSALRQAYLVGNETDSTPTNPDKKTTHKAEPSDLKPHASADKNHKSKIHLDTPVEEEGLNFSLGQQQLMALARALVRNAQIIVCDEATSSVDMSTDTLIQKTIASGFRGRTLLYIAHRLKTIIGYNRICVMDAGEIAELGTPLELWDREGGFRGMCERSGIRREEILAGGS